MPWQIITSGGTSVTLPLAPSRVTEGNPAQTEVFLVSGGSPIIISIGLDAKSLTIEGSIYSAGSSVTILESAFLAPLRAKLHTEIYLVDPDGQYNGYWVLASFDPKRFAEGAVARFDYVMKLLQGSSHVIL